MITSMKATHGSVLCNYSKLHTCRPIPFMGGRIKISIKLKNELDLPLPIFVLNTFDELGIDMPACALRDE